jgi:hypothetical protein
MNYKLNQDTKGEDTYTHRYDKGAAGAAFGEVGREMILELRLSNSGSRSHNFLTFLKTL